MSKYLEFVFVRHKPKTKVFNVVARKNDEILGRIAWYGKWRQYALEPLDQTVFNNQCLKDICKFIEKLETERKIKVIKR